MRNLLVRLRYPRPQTIFVTLMFSLVAFAALRHFHISHSAAWLLWAAVMVWTMYTASVMIYWLMKSRKMQEEIELIAIKSGPHRIAITEIVKNSFLRPTKSKYFLWPVFP